MALPTAPTPPPPRSRSRMWVGALLVLFLSAFAATVYYYLENEEKAQIIDDLTLGQEELEAELKDLEGRTDALDAALAESNLKLKDKENQVNDLLNRVEYLQTQVATYIKQGKVLERQKQRFEGMYKQLDYYNQKYRNEIAALKKENAALRDQVADLTDRSDSLVRETDQLQSRVYEQDIVLESGKALRATGFKFSAVKRFDSETGDALNSRDLRDKLRICCSLSPNAMATQGARDLVVVIRHGGIRQAVVDWPEQAATITYQGQQLTAAASTTVIYRGEATPVCFNYQVPEGYRIPEGEYIAEVYTGGFLVGKGRFRVV